MNTVNIENNAYVNLLEIYKNLNLNIPYGIFKVKVLKNVEENDLSPIDTDSNRELIEQVRQPEWLEYVTLVPVSVVNRLYSIMEYRVDLRKYSDLEYIKLNKEVYFPLLANSQTILLNELLSDSFKVGILSEKDYTKLDDDHKALELKYEVGIISLGGLLKMCHYYKLKKLHSQIFDILNYENIKVDINEYIEEIPPELINSISIEFTNRNRIIVNKSRIKVILDDKDITSSIYSLSV